jgi:hypothetical protein
MSPSTLSCSGSGRLPCHGFGHHMNRLFKQAITAGNRTNEFKILKETTDLHSLEQVLSKIFLACACRKRPLSHARSAHARTHTRTLTHTHTRTRVLGSDGLGAD